MKTISHAITFLAALCVIENVHAQSSGPAADSATPEPPPTVSAATPLPSATPGSSPIYQYRTQPPASAGIVAGGQPVPAALPAPTREEAPGDVEQAQAEAELARAAVEQQADRITSVVPGQFGNSYALGWAGYGQPGHAEKALVIRTSETDAKSLSNTEEDLNIMGRILEKAISQSADEQPKAMGIPVLVSDRQKVRNLQIEG